MRLEVNNVVSGAEPPVQRGRYEILRVVNRGGMGEIALGRVKGTKGFEKLVVLKRLRADAEREDHVQMFDVEQEVMSRIEHPNIVKVFDQPILDSIPYLAMEYVRGRNLDQIIRQAQLKNEVLPLSFSLAVVTEVLRGLAFVHRLKDNDGKALGVVHQDMTPSNVMVSFFGEVKITDFGISYVTSRDGGLRKGVLKGKPRYVAPEVLGGKRVNNRADVYGVGVVLYELLTGQALFARATVKETLAAVARNELPDLHKELGHFGEGVPRILYEALRKDPQDRYRTAESMAADIVSEAAKTGGFMPPARIGYILRQLFKDDPDVPETDAALEEILARDTSTDRPSLKPQNLQQTLADLDRLLGPENSVDLFTLPPDLKEELKDINDPDPFLALTPLPEFMQSARNDEEILQRANKEFGLPAVKPLAAMPTFPSSPSSPSSPSPAIALVSPEESEMAARRGTYSQVHRRPEAVEADFGSQTNTPRQAQELPDNEAETRPNKQETSRSSASASTRASAQAASSSEISTEVAQPIISAGRPDAIPDVKPTTTAGREIEARATDGNLSRNEAMTPFLLGLGVGLLAGAAGSAVFLMYLF